MHCYAKAELGITKRNTVQPHWFGDRAFKATGFELHNLPDLKRTHWMELPEKGTREYKEWSSVHYESPGPDRAKNRSRTFPQLAEAMAEQWGAYVESMA